MRTTHVSFRQQAHFPSRTIGRLHVPRLAVMIALFLAAVPMLAQAGSTGVQRANSATCTVPCNVDNSGDWRTPANWAPPAVSDPTGDVCIDRTAADLSVMIDIPAVVDNLTSTGNFAPPSSNSLELTVPVTPALALTAPVNDDFANATALGSDAGSLIGETNVDASSEVGEPSHDGLTSTPIHSVWFQWTPTVDGTAVLQITVPLVPNDWDMVLAAYTGSAVDALTEVAATSTFAYSVALQFEVVAGTTYHVAVDGRNSDQYGSFDLTWVTHLAPLNDDFASATLLGADSGSLIGETNAWATAEPGEPNHDGLASTPAHSVWYQWTPSVDAAASFVMTTPVSPDDWDSVLAVYTGTAVGALTEVAANRTVGTYLPLDFSVTGGTTYHLAVDGRAADQMGAFDLSWSIWPDDGHFIVTKTEDTDDGACDADCSLREAIIAANTTPGDDVIDLPAATYLLTIKGSPSVNPAYGDLDIEREQGTTTILGSGRDVTVIDASGLRSEPVPRPDRVFTVHYHAGLELVGVTVTGGYTENALSADRDGGGIWNGNGTLTVTDCLIEGNVAGGNGGGIANSYGTATISNTIIRDNNTDPPDYTATGYGGGIYNTGTMTIFDSTIELNASDYGGGIANEEWLEDYPATLDIENSVITNNTAERGGGLANVFLGTATVTDSLFTGNHATRNWDVGLNTYNRGGGILNWAADLTIIRSTITGNEARATHAIHPASGGGGGIANDLGDLTVIDSTVSGNEAICDQKLPGDPDLCGRGGGIVNAGGYATIVNSTISGNTTALLNSDHSPYLGGGGGGGFAHMPQLSGTTIYCPVTVLDSVTITDNTGAHGGGINTRWETRVGLLYYVEEWRVGTNANGHPILECLDLYVRNTIVAENTATFTIGTEDCWGGYTSADHNLVGDATGCPADGPGDVTTLDARLGPLADNGGATLTHLPLKGSPAIDAGDTSLTVDQRGVARPVGPADDIGAAEAPVYPNQPPVLDVIGAQSVAEGATLDVGITAADADGDPLIFTLSGEPDFAALMDHGDGTATLSFTPDFDDAGDYPGVTVTASDGVGSDSETFTITVTNTNQAPMLDAIGNQSVVEGGTLSVTITASDLDGDSLTFGMTGEPAFATLIDPGGGTATLSLIPGSGTVGVYPGVTITVSDNVDVDSEMFTVTVTVEESHPVFLPLVLRSD